MRWHWLMLVGLAAKAADQQPTPLDRYIEDARRAGELTRPAGTSLYHPDGPLAEMARDSRARLPHDVVTIVVAEQATALSRGSTTSARTSNAKSSVTGLFGPVARGFGNLAGGGSSSSLDGEGSTSRESTISTRLTARVSEVLPNGYLVLEGHKEVMVNSERQMVTVRGVIRPADLRPDNSVRSDRLAQMEIRINGKGVVEDAIKRPFFLYRLLLGLLPF